jgi:DNA-binding NarL/FixJ family response regulator
LVVSFDPATASPGLACLLAGTAEPGSKELEALFAREGIEVLGVAQTGLEALKILEQRPATAIVVDSRLLDLDWREFARRAAEIVWRQTFVVLHTSDPDSRSAARALDAGARGIVLKSAAHSSLLEACLRAADGEIYVDPALR